jgi:hypothetical protein
LNKARNPDDNTTRILSIYYDESRDTTVEGSSQHNQVASALADASQVLVGSREQPQDMPARVGTRLPLIIGGTASETAKPTGSWLDLHHRVKGERNGLAMGHDARRGAANKDCQRRLLSAMMDVWLLATKKLSEADALVVQQLSSGLGL